MNWSRPCAKDNPNLTFQRWLEIHDEKEKRGVMKKLQSKKVIDLASVGKNHRHHMAVGDPYADFAIDKALDMEMRRFTAAMGERASSCGSPTSAFERDAGPETPSRRSEASSRGASSRLGSIRSEGPRGLEQQPRARFAQSPVPALPLPLGQMPGRAAGPGGEEAHSLGAPAPLLHGPGSTPPAMLPPAQGALGRSSSFSALQGGHGGARPGNLLAASHSAASLGRSADGPETAKGLVPWPTSASNYMGCRRGTTLTLG